jgi:hypothetical protein
MDFSPSLTVKEMAAEPRICPVSVKRLILLHKFEFLHGN